MTSAIKVAVGTRVEVSLIDDQGNSERLTFDLVPAEAADFDQGRLGENTPLAQAILGQTAGCLVHYEQGDINHIRVLNIMPSPSPYPTDTLSRRQAKLRRALTAIERTNAAVFASSFSGKWGDYDPAGLDAWDDETEAGDEVP